MDVVLRYGFQAVQFANHRPESQREGQKLLESNHVYGVQENKSSGVENSLITGSVIHQARVNLPPYDVSIQVVKKMEHFYYKYYMSALINK